MNSRQNSRQKIKKKNTIGRNGWEEMRIIQWEVNIC